jgi:phosphatidylserine synthase
MKTQLINTVIFSIVLLTILSFYFMSNISFASLKNLGFIIGSLLILYFLFINVTLHYIDFRDNLKLKRYPYAAPGLKKALFIFFGILVVISLLTYFNIKYVQIVPFFINKEYNYMLITCLLLYLFFQEARKHTTSTK